MTNPEEVKDCPYCAEEIKAAAVKCRYCGEFLTDELRSEQFEKKNNQSYNHGLALVLSIIGPGFGQFYQGRTAIGFFWIILVILIGFVTLMTFNSSSIGFLIVLWIVIHLLNIADAAVAEPIFE